MGISYQWTISENDFCLGRNTLKSPNFGSLNNLSWYIQLDFQGSTSNVQLRLFLNNYKKTAAYAKFKLTIFREKMERSVYETEREFIHPLGSSKVINWDYEKIVGKASDPIKLLCEITVLDIMKNSDHLCRANVADCNLLQDLQNIFKERKFCDFTFYVGGKKIRAHKVILSGRSSVFAAMIENDFSENKQNCVTIKDVDHEVFKEMLRFIYTGHAKQLESMADQLLIVSDKYLLWRLKVICEEVLIKKISLRNVCDLLVLAERHNANQLKVQTMEYIKNNFAKVKDMVGWIKIKNSDPSLVIATLETCVPTI